MDRAGSRALGLVAAQLVAVTAVVHLVWGVPRALAYANPAALQLYATTGALPDPRPFLFVLSAVAIFAGLVATRRGYLPLSTAYALGLAMMATYVVGWALWHTTGHGELLFGQAIAGAEAAGHDHAGVLATLVDHVVALPLETLTKTVEVIAAAIFAVLLRTDPALDRATDAESTNADAD